MRRFVVLAVFVSLALALLIAWVAQPSGSLCRGSAKCIQGKLDKILDGDTIEIDGQTVRLSLVNTPEKGSPGYEEAISFIERICPIRSEIVVDEDDMQISRSHRRIIAVVYCRGTNLNEALLESGNAWVLEDFCSSSEFSGEPWAKSYGC